VSLIRGLLSKFIPTYTVAGSKFNQLVVDINNVPCHWMVCIIFLSYIENVTWKDCSLHYPAHILCFVCQLEI
jgi:hypothetical protein